MDSNLIARLERAADIDALGVEVRDLRALLRDAAAALRGAEDARREIAASGVEQDDPRLDYVTVQIDRATWEALQRGVEDARPNRQQCPYCHEWCAHGFCGRCERVLRDAPVCPQGCTAMEPLTGWRCPECYLKMPPVEDAPAPSGEGFAGLPESAQGFAGLPESQQPSGGREARAAASPVPVCPLHVALRLAGCAYCAAIDGAEVQGAASPERGQDGPHD
jgi:hypothetical protein